MQEFRIDSTGESLPAVKNDKGEWFFSAQDTCVFAEVSTAKNATTWIKNNVPSKWLLEIKIPGKEGRPSLYLTKPGFYYAVSQGKSLKAIEFRDWVFEVLLLKIEASGGYIMPTATSEQLSGLIKEANQKLLALYKSRDVSYKKDKTGAVKMTVYKNRKKEYETYISDSSSPSLVNPQILIIGHYDKSIDSCDIDIDSPLKEAYVRYRDYCHSSDRTWTRDELEEWIRVNFPVK
jgi:prophage antirepressor-like protein